MGQKDFTEPTNPRFSLAFHNLGTDDGSNYVKKCSFNKNFNTAIGIFSSNNFAIESNVIYYTVGSSKYSRNFAVCEHLNMCKSYIPLHRDKDDPNLTRALSSAGIIDEGEDNSFRFNLVSLLFFPGTYNGESEMEYQPWEAGFYLNKASRTILEGNVVAGKDEILKGNEISVL